jgi:5-methylcytosine-specific restriction endonuclease McrA
MICKHCGNEYQKMKANQIKYCSLECRLAANKPKPGYTKLPAFDIKCKPDSKYCKACDKQKPLSEFRLRKKPNGMRSYGRCKQCEHHYDYLRRRNKGIPIRMQKEKKALIKSSAHDIKAVNRMKAHIRHRESCPIVTHACKECNVIFEGTMKRRFCTQLCSDGYHRRIRKKKERARMRILKVDNVDPIKVFEKHNWHCAKCGIYTPRHLKGKQKDNSPELDHIIPLSRNGEHSYVNVQLLCRQCNLTKLDSVDHSLLSNIKFQYEMFPNMGGRLTALPI